MFGVHKLIPNNMLTIIACIALVGCSLITIDVLPMDFPYEAMLERTEIGDEWIMTDSGSTTVENTLGSYSVSFAYRSDEKLENPSIGHMLFVYHNEEAAASGFKNLEEEYFPGAYWPEPPGVSISPRDASDNTRFGCKEILMNSQPRTSCAYLQQHDEYMWMVFINLDNEVITMNDLIRILKRLEWKINQLEESIGGAA